MSAIITVENLSKAYRIGLKEAIPDTLVGAIVGLAKAPWRNLRRLRRLNTSSLAPNSELPTPNSDLLWALRDVSFEVQEGEVLGIIGRNGAGKSTLLKLLSRITEPTAGRAVIRGRVSSLLEVGTGFHPELTGRENVYMNGTILGMTKREIDRKFDEIVDFSGVERFLDTPVKRYSSGMTVRLAFAVAAHLEPEVLVIDEVLAVGDAEFQKKCLGKMQDVARGGRTVLFVSHNMGAVQALCARGILLRQGALVVDGTVNDAIDEYQGYLQQHAGVNLDNPERSGTGEVRLIGARVRDHQGGITSSLIAGRQASFEFDYDNVGHRPRFDVTMTVYDHLGVAITNLSTTYEHFVVKSARARGTVSCELPRIPFLPGNYRLAVAVHDGGAYFDLIPNALLFAVDSSVFFASQSLPRRLHCTCMVDHHWQQ